MSFNSVLICSLLLGGFIFIIMAISGPRFVFCQSVIADRITLISSIQNAPSLRTNEISDKGLLCSHFL